MSYEYKHKDLMALLKKAGSINNLAANTGIAATTLQYLVNHKEAWASSKTEEKLEPFVSGTKKIEQLKRPYKRKV